jgi:hypothetical protein
MSFRSSTSNESKRMNKPKRFCRWICIPFSRGKKSYIEEITPRGSVSDKKQPHSGLVTLDTWDTRSSSHDDEKLEDDLRPCAQYPPALSSHANSSSQARVVLTWSYTNAFASSTYCPPTSRNDTQSPDFDAPRVQGQARVRSKSAKNKDLPGCLRAQPRPLTKEYLEINERRYSSSSSHPLINRVSDAPTHRECRSSNSDPDARRMEERLQLARKNHRLQVKQNALPLRRSNDRLRCSRSQRSRDASRGPRMYQPAPGCNLHARPHVVPLSSDSNKVLVHSKSRGFKVVRDMMSIERLREMMMQPRHDTTLERMLEDDQQAYRELTSEYCPCFKRETKACANELHVCRHHDCDCGGSAELHCCTSIIRTTSHAES